MGYYTEYNLSFVAESEDQHEEILNELSEISGYHADIFSGVDTVKWYDHVKDMVKLSTLYQDILFTLEGEGEESGDLWRAYFKNGKHVRNTAKIVFPDFNEEEL